MIKIFNFSFRAFRFLFFRLYLILNNYICFFLFKILKVKVKQGFKFNGIPKLFIHHTAKVEIGFNFSMNNFVFSNPIGRSPKCLFAIKPNAILTIGNNVGMSGTSIVCTKQIEIGDYVKIGGNVCIYDTDFHSLKACDRMLSNTDKKNTISKPVTIGNNVFIGAHSTVLKGVSIGDNSIIGASSLVSKDIPSNQIWAGNPAKFIKNIHAL